MASLTSFSAMLTSPGSPPASPGRSRSQPPGRKSPRRGARGRSNTLGALNLDLETLQETISTMNPRSREYEKTVMVFMAARWKDLGRMKGDFQNKSKIHVTREEWCDYWVDDQRRVKMSRAIAGKIFDTSLTTRNPSSSRSRVRMFDIERTAKEAHKAWIDISSKGDKYFEKFTWWQNHQRAMLARNAGEVVRTAVTAEFEEKFEHLENEVRERQERVSELLDQLQHTRQAYETEIAGLRAIIESRDDAASGPNVPDRAQNPVYQSEISRLQEELGRARDEAAEEKRGLQAQIEELTQYHTVLKENHRKEKRVLEKEITALRFELDHRREHSRDSDGFDNPDDGVRPELIEQISANSAGSARASTIMEIPTKQQREWKERVALQNYNSNSLSGVSSPLSPRSQIEDEKVEEEYVDMDMSDWTTETFVQEFCTIVEANQGKGRRARSSQMIGMLRQGLMEDGINFDQNCRIKINKRKKEYTVSEKPKDNCLLVFVVATENSDLLRAYLSIGGINVNIAGKVCPLYRAVATGNVWLVSMLLEDRPGIDLSLGHVDTFTKVVTTPLELAIRNDWTDITAVLEAYASQ